MYIDRYWTPSVAGLVAELVDAREALAELRQVAVMTGGDVSD